MEIKLPGKRVFVSGGAAGIGRVIAQTFAACGARVHVCDVSDEALAAFSAANPSISTSKTDISDRKAVDRLFDKIGNRLGGLDVIVNNASIAGSTAPVEKIDPDEWEKVFAVNVHGMFYCTRRAIPMLKAAGEGSIVNIASVAGRLAYALRSPYSVSKWAVVGLTQCLAMELGAYKVRANAIMPGIVKGARRQGNTERRAKLRGVSVQQIEAEAVARVALGQMVEPEEIAEMAVFLSSRMARNITGQSINVDGYLQALTDSIPREN